MQTYIDALRTLLAKVFRLPGSLLRAEGDSAGVVALLDPLTSADSDVDGGMEPLLL